MSRSSKDRAVNRMRKRGRTKGVWHVGRGPDWDESRSSDWTTPAHLRTEHVEGASLAEGFYKIKRKIAFENNTFAAKTERTLNHTNVYVVKEADGWNSPIFACDQGVWFADAGYLNWLSRSLDPISPKHRKVAERFMSQCNALSNSDMRRVMRYGFVGVAVQAPVSVMFDMEPDESVVTYYDEDQNPVHIFTNMDYASLEERTISKYYS